MHATYLFELNYGERMREKIFIASVLNRYDIKRLSGASLIVNNNPYGLELYLHLTFQSGATEFEEWLRTNYIHYFQGSRKYNYFLDDVLFSMGEKGYSVCTLLDSNDLDMYITPYQNHLFLFPDKETMEGIWKGGLKSYINRQKVFISHSSKDKHLVDKIFNEFQKNEVPTFYDKHEIFPADNIRDIINLNLQESKIGVVCVSSNFNMELSEWLKHEVQYFKDKGILIIPLNINLDKKEVKRIIGDIRYINLDKQGLIELITIAKKSLNKR
ncbi:TIR domain-containing protein [Bacillus cereus]|uniref:TIR domain-containing protein n=1 Tax=Bacillus cereus TaxID=1396 RepID=A0A9X7E169_BACCE|nr:toll/interleukin-1 receptor domain-containing protein [Bacillus cereus]PHA25581.1 TIR domain-containing protein [Bacillus cereus]PHG74881.1 TIR domain-containing protein [Bacillus cereus]